MESNNQCLPSVQGKLKVRSFASENNINIEKANVSSKGTLQLSEIYVHRSKRPCLENNTENEQFEIFHIYELVTCQKRMTPKLSTNCTEPQKIINAVMNSPGSNLSVTQQLIKNLREQSMLFNYLLAILQD